METKFLDEMRNNVCEKHLGAINHAASFIIFNPEKGDEVQTSETIRSLFGVGEYGFRFLMDIMSGDKESDNECKMNTIEQIQNDFEISRSRIDDILTQIEFELLDQMKAEPSC